MEDKDILDYKIGDHTVRDISSSSYLHWVAKKIDGLQAYTAAVTELRYLLVAPTLGIMPETEKIRIFRKLISLNVPL